jgi:hypothetical protein
MTGRIASIDIIYTIQTPDGPKATRHHLYDMRKHLRPDRVEELTASLASICDDILAARQSRSGGRHPDSHPHRTGCPL